MLSRTDLQYRVSLIHRYGKVSFATIVATSFMRSITSFAVRQHRFPTANENDICAFGAKWCSSLRSEIRPYGSWSPFPQGKADGYRYLTVGLTHFIFFLNIIRVWVRQPAAQPIIPKPQRKTTAKGQFYFHLRLRRGKY